MIWDFAMPDTFIEAGYCSDKGRFQSSKSPASTSSVPKTKLLPIYLKPGPFMMSYRQRYQMVNGVLVDIPIEPIYIQSGDIVYIPELWALDADAFLERKENQAIEHLAIPAHKVPGIGPLPGLRESEVSKVVRGLKKLKNLYIVEGSKFGSERVPLHEGEKYSFSWSKVKEGPELNDLSSSLNLNWALMHPGQFEWDTGLADAVARSISKALEDIAKIGERWDPPQLIFRELRRTLVK